MTELPTHDTATAPAIVWCIAGSDSGGGAGIQADIPTVHALGGHPATALTSVTAQNSVGVQVVEPVSEALFRAQLDSLEADLPPQAIKIGLLSECWQIHCLQDRLPQWKAQWPGLKIVLDPVLVATSGDALAQKAVVAALHDLLPWVDMLTPNLPELAALVGQPMAQLAHQEHAIAAAQTLIKTGCGSVVVKGGHASWGDQAQPPQCIDVLITPDSRWPFSQPRVDSPHTHGTGCTLSSALATGLAQDHPPEDALVIAITYLQRALRQAYSTGSGSGTPKRWLSDDRAARTSSTPVYVNDKTETKSRHWFLPCTHDPLGLYPVVPDTNWLARVLRAGVKTVQLRVKGPSNPHLRDEINAAVRLGQQYGAQVFINDHWELAIDLGAYGVHLGQEDLTVADLSAIQSAGLRLGVSTHGYAELLRALAIKPSYVALGHVFPTQTKTMPSKPQGLKRLADYQALAERAGIASVAIGGIKPHHLPAIRDCGVRSVAMVTAITEAGDPEAVISQLSAAINTPSPSGVQA